MTGKQKHNASSGQALLQAVQNFAAQYNLGCGALAVLILDEAGLAPQADALYGVWASRGGVERHDGHISGPKPFCSGLGVVELPHSVEDQVGSIALLLESRAHLCRAEAAARVEFIFQLFGQPPGAETHHLEAAIMLGVPLSW